MGIFKRNDSPFWWYWLEGTTITASTKIPIQGSTPTKTKEHKAAALDLYNAHMGDLARGTFKLRQRKSARRFDDHLDWYLTHVSPNHKAHEQELSNARPLREFFAAYDVTMIDRELVSEYMTKRLKQRRTVYLGKFKKPRVTDEKVKASSINREVDLLKSVMKSAAPKYIDDSPIEGMPRLKTAPVRRGTMSLENEEKVLAAMARDDKALYLLAVDSLVRAGDCFDLRRCDVKGNTADIVDPKSGESYRVPLSKRTVEALDAVQVYERDPEHYFGRRRFGKKTQLARAHAVLQMFKQACERAGVTYGRKHGISFHWSTRRTGLSRMLQSNEVSIATAQKIGNWKRPDLVLQVYAETINEQEHAAVEIVGRRNKAS